MTERVSNPKLNMLDAKHLLSWNFQAHSIRNNFARIISLCTMFKREVSGTKGTPRETESTKTMTEQKEWTEHNCNETGKNYTKPRPWPMAIMHHIKGFSIIVRIPHLRIPHWGAILRWGILSQSVIRITHPNYYVFLCIVCAWYGLWWVLGTRTVCSITIFWRTKQLQNIVNFDSFTISLYLHKMLKEMAHITFFLDLTFPLPHHGQWSSSLSSSSSSHSSSS